MSTGWKMGAPSMTTAKPMPMMKLWRQSTWDSTARLPKILPRKGRSQARYLGTGVFYDGPSLGARRGSFVDLGAA